MYFQILKRYLMSNLFSKDEPIEKSSVYVGYQILKVFKDEGSKKTVNI